MARQVLLEIVSAIENGSMAGSDGQIPSEAELSQRFGVSRGTVREALSQLEVAGLVVRRHGAGTYVNPKMSSRPGSIHAWFDEATAFMDMIRHSNHEAAVRILRTAVVPAEDLAGCLEVEASSPVVHMEKLLFSASIPIIHCANYVPLCLVEPSLVDRAADLFGAAETNYRFLERHCNRTVHHQQSEISAVEADEVLAAFLECRVGAPLLRVEEVGYASDLVPVFYGVNHFRGDLVKFRQLRRPSIDIADPKAE